MNTAAQNLPLVISDTLIHQDAEGRYCLNDLHKAAGGESKYQPAFFVRRDETKELIEELSSANMQNITPLETVQGKGKDQGTYVVKELVYAYAMWISPAFSLKVIRAYDALVTGITPNTEALLTHTLQQLADTQSQSIALCQEMLALKDSQIQILTKKFIAWGNRHQADEIAAASRCRVEGYTYADIAELLGRSQDAVKHMVRKAKGGAL